MAPTATIAEAPRALPLWFSRPVTYRERFPLFHLTSASE